MPQNQRYIVGLLLLGALPRIMAALVLVAALWAAFFWATAPLGPL